MKLNMQSGGSVTIDGVVQDGELTGDINVTVEGDVNSLTNESGNVSAYNAGSIETVSGDVECLDVEGSVKTVSGDVVCKSIGGNVKTVSGDIDRNFK